MSVLITVTLVVLVFNIIYQIGKASEYSVILRGEEKVKAQANRVVAFMLLLLFPVGCWGIWYCNSIFKDRLLPVAACPTGVNYDSMFKYSILDLNDDLFNKFGYKVVNKSCNKQNGGC